MCTDMKIDTSVLQSVPPGIKTQNTYYVGVITNMGVNFIIGNTFWLNDTKVHLCNI
jgi:hypothetical protein